MKQFHTNLWARLQDFTYAHKRLSIGLVVGAVVISASSVAATWFLLPKAVTTTQKPQTTTDTAVVTPAAKKYYSPLTGVEVPDEATSKRQITAIMIENSVSARPQSGIKEAGLVFEAIAEGGITRLATLHQEDRPQLIGPVRSLRPYYLDWIAPFDASISHVGGSANALNAVRSGAFKDIDQFYNGGTYWRATDRDAPHNVYTSFDKIDALNQKKGFTSSTFAAWPRKTENAAEKITASKIDIPVSGAAYNVKYDYDKASNTYVRQLGGEPSKDREGGQVTPKVVVVMKVPTQQGFEDGYREQMTTNGTNELYVFQDGVVLRGFWHKDTQKSQMYFYDKNAHLIAFSPGQTWVTVTAPEKNVTWQ